MNKKIFITTAIPYVNSKAHIGHCQEFLLADTLCQLLKNQGNHCFLQTGTDDNSLKNAESAKKQGLSLEEFLPIQISQFKELLSKLNIYPDYFISTSSKEHKQVVEEFIKSLEKDDLYEAPYQGLYCVGCEDFLKPQELVDGCCVDHKTVPKTITETNVFFKLSKYQSEIRELINSDKIKITPVSKKAEVLSFIDQGLHDISISRPDPEKIGVPFPEKEGHSVYVWIDALINYITGSGFKENKWTEDYYKIQVIGKNVWKFHCIYWVALLLSAKKALPNEFLIHGFLTNEGEKISKSLGNYVDPLDILKNFDSDTLRSFLIGKLSYENDSDFSETGLKVFYQQELLNQIGNLFPRVFSIATSSGVSLKRNKGVVTTSLKDSFKELLDKTHSLNKEINDSFIWKKEHSLEKLKTIESWGNQLNEIADLFCLFVPTRKLDIDKSFSAKVFLFKKLT
jgi:methionyl-tRNA synthetase